MGLSPGHRHLIHYLMSGGLIQQDDSGVGWVCATRSGDNFRNETVDRLRERGFSHQRSRYQLVRAHGNKLMATPAPPKPRRKEKGEP